MTIPVTDELKAELLDDCRNCPIPDECRPYRQECLWQKGIKEKRYPPHIIGNPPSFGEGW